MKVNVVVTSAFLSTLLWVAPNASIQEEFSTIFLCLSKSFLLLDGEHFLVSEYMQKNLQDTYFTFKFSLAVPTYVVTIPLIRLNVSPISPSELIKSKFDYPN